MTSRDIDCYILHLFKYTEGELRGRHINWCLRYLVALVTFLSFQSPLYMGVIYYMLLQTVSVAQVCILSGILSTVYWLGQCNLRWIMNPICSLYISYIVQPLSSFSVVKAKNILVKKNMFFKPCFLHPDDFREINKERNR